MCREKGLKIGFRNPQYSVEAVRDQKALFDPAPNSAGADAEAFSDLFDREESFFGRFARGGGLLWSGVGAFATPRVRSSKG